jgi:hypothetical protein
VDQAIELSNVAAPEFQIGSMQCGAPEAIARGKLVVADDVFRQWWGNAPLLVVSSQMAAAAAVSSYPASGREGQCSKGGRPIARNADLGPGSSS